jgi:hypothetical protein
MMLTGAFEYENLSVIGMMTNLMFSANTAVFSPADRRSAAELLAVVCSHHHPDTVRPHRSQDSPASRLLGTAVAMRAPGCFRSGAALRLQCSN